MDMGVLEMAALLAPLPRVGNKYPIKNNHKKDPCEKSLIILQLTETSQL